MADQWMLRGVEYSNCNCSYGCGCQFQAPSTHGFCEAMGAGHIEEGYFNETRLEGFNFVMLFQWLGEVAEGNGSQQLLIDSKPCRNGSDWTGNNRTLALKALSCCSQSNRSRSALESINICCDPFP